MRGIIHVLLYLLILWLPIQGMLLTWIGGYDVVVLGLYHPTKTRRRKSLHFMKSLKDIIILLL